MSAGNGRNTLEHTGPKVRLRPSGGLRLRRSPSIVPQEADQGIYLVLEGQELGRAWRETDT
jgi:hypothetical protein